MDAPDPQFTTQTAKGGACREAVLSGVEVRRDGHNVPFLHVHPAISSADIRWSGIALEQYSTPACLISRHEHLEHFVHVVRSGSCNYQVNTGGKTRKFVANPGTIFLLPQGTVDELIWNGPVLRIAVSIRPDLLLITASFGPEALRWFSAIVLLIQLIRSMSTIAFLGF